MITITYNFKEIHYIANSRECHLGATCLQQFVHYKRCISIIAQNPTESQRKSCVVLMVQRYIYTKEAIRPNK